MHLSDDQGKTGARTLVIHIVAQSPFTVESRSVFALFKIYFVGQLIAHECSETEPCDNVHSHIEIHVITFGQSESGL